MKSWKNWLLWLVFFGSFGFAGGSAFLFSVLVPYEQRLAAARMSPEQIDSSLSVFVYGWLAFALLVSIFYFRLTLAPRSRPRAAHVAAAVSLLAAGIMVAVLFFGAGARVVAARRSQVVKIIAIWVLGPNPELALEEYRAGQFQRALPLLETLVARGTKDRAIHLALARTYFRVGRNVDAAKTYRAMVERTPGDHQASEAFLGIYGYPVYRPDLPLSPPRYQRPAERQMLYRTSGDSFQVLEGGKWRKVYLMGVNIGPARPGEYPTTAARDFGTYAEWFRQIAAMNANTVRVYSILPPAFYQALKEYNQGAQQPLWLIQEVWIHDEMRDLFDPQDKQQFEQEVRNVVDLLHGQADIPCRPGANCGIYTADVSQHVIGLAIGREIEPALALRTNRLHPAKTSYQGRYISLREGNPTEAWFAEECDLVSRYEAEKYNLQQPLGVVNWPPLDPLFHQTAATYAEELEFRKKGGEAVTEKAPEDANDADVVSLDVTRFQTGPEFTAGLFAFYNVYQHWPDFMFREPSYATVRDDQGPNRYLGYLRDLKRVHRNFPLVIGEYGLSTSLGVAHLHPDGWNNGGFSEQAQAEVLARFTRNIRDTGCAGGLVFAWHDEWYKHVHDRYTADFEVPRDRDPLWNNQLDPEEHFGIVGYEPSATVPWLRAEPSDWNSSRVLYSRPAGSTKETGAGPIKTVYAMADYAYLYLRLDVDPQGKTWNQWNYWIALNTLPGQAGSRILPQLGIRVESGANFLVQLSGPDKGRLLIAQNYNPNQRIVVPGRPGLTRIGRKLGMNVALADQAGFEEILTEANPPGYARDGQWFAPLEFNRSPLPQGTADRSKPGYSNRALWHADGETGMIEIRLPWGLLFVTDPSSLQAFAGTDREWKPQVRTMRGVSVAVFAVRGGDPATLGGAFPSVVRGRTAEEPAVFTWDPWEEVQVRPYFKQGYYSLQREWKRIRQSDVP